MSKDEHRKNIRHKNYTIPTNCEVIKLISPHWPDRISQKSSFKCYETMQFESIK